MKENNYILLFLLSFLCSKQRQEVMNYRNNKKQIYDTTGSEKI